MRGLGLCVSSAALLLAGLGLVGSRVARDAAAEVVDVAAGHTGDLHRVATLRLEGAGVPRAVLETALATRVGLALREQDLAQDRRALAAQLIDRGYLAADVHTTPVSWRRDGAHVTFAIEPGGLYRVGAVKVTGAVLRRLPQLREVPTLLAGQAWSADRAAANQTVLRDWLARRGVRADVSMTTTIDHARLAVDVGFVVARR